MRPRDYMQIPNEIRKCVCYLGHRLPSGDIKIGGTAFFVSRPWMTEGKSFVYAVTAGHNLQRIDEAGADVVLLRVNLKTGGFRLIETSIRSWLFHPEDEAVDVAIMRVSFTSDVDHIAFPVDGFTNERFLQDNQIGPGDEVFLPGLFSPHKGESRNIPIIRTGAIAAMNEEPVPVELPGKVKVLMDAYLAECRSIGGLSGSPVFVTPGLVRFLDGKTSVLKNPHRSFRLMGLIHGHFSLPPFEPIIGDDPVSRERLNMGIAIVQNSTKILEVLNQPFVMQKEKEAGERAKRESATREGAAVMDCGFQGEPDEEPFTKEDFEAALKKASRRLTED